MFSTTTNERLHLSLHYLKRFRNTIFWCSKTLFNVRCTYHYSFSILHFSHCRCGHHLKPHHWVSCLSIAPCSTHTRRCTQIARCEPNSARRTKKNVNQTNRCSRNGAPSERSLCINRSSSANIYRVAVYSNNNNKIVRNKTETPLAFNCKNSRAPTAERRKKIYNGISAIRVRSPVLSCTAQLTWTCGSAS